MTAKILFIVEDGVDDLELYYAYNRVLEKNHQPVIASHTKYTNRLILDEKTGSIKREVRVIKGKRGVEFKVDMSYTEALQKEWDGLVIPGGRSPERARLYSEARQLVNRILHKYKPVLAICHGPLLLASAGVLDGIRVTGHYGIGDDLRNAGAVYTGSPAEVDGCIVTARHTTTIHEAVKPFLELVDRGGCL